MGNFYALFFYPLCNLSGTCQDLNNWEDKIQ